MAPCLFNLFCIFLNRMAPFGSDALWFDVHHDGFFEGNPLRYEDGLVYEWKLYKSKKMDKRMCDFLNDKTNHVSKHGLYFCLPGCDLEVGLKIIESDIDVASMYTFVESYGKLQVFMTHRHQDLFAYYEKNLFLEESGDEATSRLRIHGKRVKDASNMTVDELISWAEEDAETRTPKKKFVDHMEEDVDMPIVNLAKSPILKNKLLGRKSPSPSAKRRLLANYKCPTSYVVTRVEMWKALALWLMKQVIRVRGQSKRIRIQSKRIPIQLRKPWIRVKG